MTDGVWQGGSVMSTLRRGPCRASRHDRGRRKPPRDLLARAIAGAPSGAPSVEHPSARGTSRCAPGAFSLTAMLSPIPGVSLIWRNRCHLSVRPAPQLRLRHPSSPGVSRFCRIRCHLSGRPASQPRLRHPSLPGVSRFCRNRCHLSSHPAPRPKLLILLSICK